MESARSGVTFTNRLEGDLFLTNFVAHNGAGLAIGDVDRDGWPDLYLCGLQGPNRQYLNRGGWRFEEMPLDEAACAEQLSTGATLADIDGDGDLDLLVNGIAAGTRLFWNDGTGRWTEAKDSGLSRTASATSLALADIDGDGDLDLYCTHFIDAMHLADPTSRFAIARKGDQWEVTKFNGESTRSPKWKGRFEALPGGKVRELPEVHGLYRNDGRGRFQAIEFEPGTYQDEEGKPIPPYRDWGLAAMFRDLNRDGHPDLYVCNDNTSPDRIWINTGTGQFRAIASKSFRHTSRSSMGIDVGDLDRDGYDDLVIVDMLAREHARRMTQLVRDRPTQAESEQLGTRPQYNRNTLYFGRSDGTYVEAALWAGIAATDWTWCPILMDVDLDGYEDLLVTNGFEFDVMDQDSDDQIRDPRRRLTEAQLKRSAQFRPAFRTRNAAFRNRGDGGFEPVSEAWRFDHSGVSFGMAQGDLDNDGDLDLVVNHLNEAVGLYRNDATAPRIGVRLKGRPGNTEGIGARVRLTGGGLDQSQEMVGGGRYLAGDQVLRVFAVAGERSATRNLEVRWPRGGVSSIGPVEPNRVYEIDETSAKPEGAVASVTGGPKAEPLWVDTSAQLGHEHREEAFDDWSVQPMLPKRLSRLGPGVSGADVDGDGWEDIVVAAGKGDRLAVYRNAEGKGFRRLQGSEVAAGDQGSVLVWPDGQGRRRLLVAGMLGEMGPAAEGEIRVLDSVDGREIQRLRLGPVSPGPMALSDADGDGDLDLFVGGRFRPGRYPEPVTSTLWRNDRGQWVLDQERGAVWEGLGLVQGATFVDLDGDGASELVLALEWGAIRIFRMGKGGFEDVTAGWGLDGLKGWWSGVAAGDFDEDGRMDLVCGNWGRNSIYELNRPQAYRLYYGDWAQEGTFRMIELWRSGKDWHTVHDRNWLARGIPDLGIRFPTHAAFAKASLSELLGPALEKSAYHEVTELSSMVLMNRGRRLEAIPLPREAQWAPAFSVHVADGDGDGHEDVFLGQNFFGAACDLTRDDAGRGLFLRGDGRGGFVAVDGAESGIRIYGEQRGGAVLDYNRDGRVDWVLTQNGAATVVLENRGAKPGLRVVLEGPAGNPEAIGAAVQVLYAGGRAGPLRSVRAGSGYGSQDGAVPVLGLLARPEAVRVRWPGGREERVPVTDPAATLRVRYHP